MSWATGYRNEAGGLRGHHSYGVGGIPGEL